MIGQHGKIVEMSWTRCSSLPSTEFKNVQKVYKISETGSDVKKVPIEAVSQTIEYVEWLILHYPYKFHVVITCRLQGRTILMKAVRKVTHLNLNFHNAVAGKEMRSIYPGSILFLVRILVKTDICIDENTVWEQCSWSHNNILLARIFRCGKSLGSGPKASSA